MGRRMIAYQMRVEGYCLQSIGMQLIKHHASVMHMIKAMDEVFNYPKFRKLELSYWDQFKNKLKEYDNDTTRKVQANS